MTTPETNAAPIAQGTVLAGKYRVERVIGQGGMGVVVEARHLALDERVALKFLTTGYAQQPEAAARFVREARAAVKIKSEHVARVSDVGTLESGAPYMVMELLQGNDLSQELQTKGPLPMHDAVDYVVQACDAIAEAHGVGIVHRDLKPANLFLARRVDASPLVKVLDFGISKTADSAVENLTKTMSAMGSALYMSPEQMQATRGVDHRTDIYALGVALYELLAGKQPYYADTLPQLCAEVLTGTPTPLRAARPDLPAELAPVIEKAYARDRGDRYPSIAHFVVALAPFAPARTQPVIDRVARVANLPIPVAGAPAAKPAPAPVAVPPGGPLLAGGGTIAMDPPPRAPLPRGGTLALEPSAAPGRDPQSLPFAAQAARQAPPAPPPPPDAQSSTGGAGAGPQNAPPTAPNMEVALAAPRAPAANRVPLYVGLGLALLGGAVAVFFATRPAPQAAATTAAGPSGAPAQASTQAPTGAMGATATAPVTTGTDPASTDKPADAAPAADPAKAGTTARPATSARPATTASASAKPTASGKPKSIFDDR